MEDYVNLKISMLLSKRGFDEETRTYYVYNKDEIYFDLKPHRYNTEGRYDVFSAPTIQMVFKWFRENYNIYIQIEPYAFNDDGSAKGYEVTYWYKGNYYQPYSGNDSQSLYGVRWGKYEDAANAIIQYCLVELI